MSPERRTYADRVERAIVGFHLREFLAGVAEDNVTLCNLSKTQQLQHLGEQIGKR